MVDEVVIRIRKCDDCPFVQYVFTEIGTAVFACGIEDKVNWHLGGKIVDNCPLREEKQIVKKENHKRKLVQNIKCR